LNGSGFSAVLPANKGTLHDSAHIDFRFEGRLLDEQLFAGFVDHGECDGR
jgi:hypothetical protein